MKGLIIGDVDYEYDMYRNRIRRYTVTKISGRGQSTMVTWDLDDTFVAEKGLTKIEKSGFFLGGFNHGN